MTTIEPPWEFLALAALVVVTAGWVNWAWPRNLMFRVLNFLLPRGASWLRERLRPGQVLHAVLLVGVLVWIWIRYREDLHALAVLLEIAGITLLAAEVWAAQQFETHERKMSRLEQLMHMYLGRNYRGFWVMQEAGKEGATYEDVSRRAQALSDADAELYAKNLWAQLENFDKKGGVPAAVERWEKTTTHTAVWRRRRLWAGAALLILAALLSMFEGHEKIPPPPPPVDDAVKVGLRLDGPRRLPSFVPGSAELTPDIRSAICRYRETPAEWESAVAILVGRHDKTELSARTRTQFGSNASLAERRGLAIQLALTEPLFCGPEQAFAAKLSILQLDSPPRYAGSQVSKQQLAEDRSAELYLLTATARRVRERR